MAFHEVRFPTDISRGSTAGPERRTQVVALGSGFEERNQQWADSRRRYDAGYGLRSIDDIHTVIAFWEERRGRLHGFRWRDWADWKSCAPQQTPAAADQAIGTGDGVQSQFQLVKVYGSAFAPYTRTIRKPVSGTVRVAVAGVEKTITSQFTVDATTGIVTFTAGNIPAAGQAVTAGYEFDAPVRFDADELRINLAAFAAGDLPAIPVLELRL